MAPSCTTGTRVAAPDVVPVTLETQPVKQQQAAPAVVARPKPRMVAKKDAGLSAETEVIEPFSLRQHKDYGVAAMDTMIAAAPWVEDKNASADKPASESVVKLHPIREAQPAAVEDAPPKIVAPPAPAKIAEVLHELGPAVPVRPPQLEDSAQGTISHVAPVGLVPPQNTAQNTLGAGHAVPQVSGNAYAPGWPQGEDPRLQALANALAAQLLRGLPFPFPNGATNNAAGSAEP